MISQKPSGRPGLSNKARKATSQKEGAREVNSRASLPAVGRFAPSGLLSYFFRIIEMIPAPRMRECGRRATMAQSWRTHRNHPLRLALSAALGLGFSLGLSLGLAEPGFATTSQVACQVKTSIVVDASRVDASCLVTEKGCLGLREELEKIPLGIIPEPLGELTFSRDILEKMLGPAASRLVLPQQVKVRRRGDILSGKEISKKISAICQDQEATSVLEDLSIDLARVPRNIVLPGSMRSFDLQPMSSNKFGLRLFSLQVDCQGGQVRQIIQVEVSRKIRAARLNRLVKRGEILTEGDLSEEIVLQRNDQNQPLLSFADAVGKQLSVYKSPGTFLRAGDISETVAANMTQNTRGKIREEKSAWIVKPGECVDFFVRSGGLSLKVPAKALEGGGVGEPIKLINLQNNRQITGIVTAEGKVEYGVN